MATTMTKNNNKIERAIEQDARLEPERMPTDMAKVNAEKTARKKAASLRRFMDLQSLSQADVARKLGISAAVVSQFLKGKYKGDNVALAQKIVALINTVSRRTRKIQLRPFVKTATARKIGTLIKHVSAQVNKRGGAIGVICGDSGHGKTTCLEAYALAVKNTIYVQLHDGMATPRIFSALAEKAGIDATGSMDNITRRLIKVLCNWEVLIIIDEASRLSVKQLSLLRTVIVDQCKCPLILAGNNNLLQTIRQPTTRRGFQSLDQLRARMAGALDLDAMALDNSGGSGLCNADDIKSLYELAGLRLTGDGAKFLLQVARAPQSGRLWTCSRIINVLLLARSAGEIGDVVDSELIKEAIVQLRLPVLEFLSMIVPSEAEEQSQPQRAKQAG